MEIVKGQKFTLLTARERIATLGHEEESWLCDCECGNTVVATKSQLLSNRKKSCGCLRKRTPANVLDLGGQTINGIKVIERAGSTSGGTALWLCECHCGNRFTAASTLIKRGDITSCGCAKPAQIQNARNVLLAEKSIDGVPVPLLTKKVRSDSSTGHKGVYRRVRKGKEYFEASITIQGKRVWASPRTSLSEAIADRKRLEAQYHQPIIDQLEAKTMDLEQIRAWIQNNLVMQDEGRRITGQSVSGFNQSVTEGWISPFVEFGSSRKTRLYLRSELEEYAKKKRIR